MCEIIIQIKYPYCDSSKVKRNGIKKNGIQNHYCNSCKKQFQYFYKYKGSEPKVKNLIRSMSVNSRGIRDIQSVLGVSIVCVLFVLRRWFLKIEEPIISGHFKEVQIDEKWSSCKTQNTW